jgi:hypothetical protein
MHLLQKFWRRLLICFPCVLQEIKPTHYLKEISTTNEFWQSISPDSFISVFGKYERRVWLFLDHNGEHLEQFLWKLIFWPWNNLNVLVKLLEKIRVSSQLTKNVRIITLALFLQKTTKQRILKNNDLKFCNQRLRALWRNFM